jgi:hypothetical protein
MQSKDVFKAEQGFRSNNPLFLRRKCKNTNVAVNKNRNKNQKH